MWVATTIRFYGGRLLYSSTATKYGRWVGVVGEGTTETPTDEILAVRPYSLYRDYLCLYWATGDLRTKTTERIRLMNVFSKVPLPWLGAIAFHNPTLERYFIVLGKISEIRPGFEPGSSEFQSGALTTELPKFLELEQTIMFIHRYVPRIKNSAFYSQYNSRITCTHNLAPPPPTPPTME